MYENAPKLLAYRPGEPGVMKTADALVETMKHLGLDLPTPYFALHTRSFPWHQHKVERRQ